MFILEQGNISLCCSVFKLSHMLVSIWVSEHICLKENVPGFKSVHFTSTNSIFQKITFYITLLFSLFQGIWRCYLEYSRLEEQPGSHLNAYTIGIQTDISMYFRLKQTWFALSEWILKICFVKIVIRRMHLFM